MSKRTFRSKTLKLKIKRFEKQQMSQVLTLNDIKIPVLTDDKSYLANGEMSYFSHSTWSHKLFSHWVFLKQMSPPNIFELQKWGRVSYALTILDIYMSI